MHRGKTQKQVRCEEHDFMLCPANETIYNGQYYNVSFCTCRNERSYKKISKAPRNQSNLTFPVFNKDFNYSTPAFILNSEKNYYQAQGAKILEQHEKKMQNYSEEKIQINIPKPRSKNNYCSVCKSSYEDYLEHVIGDLHKRKIHQSPFNKDILELSTKYLREPHRRRRISKNMIEKNVSTTRIQDSDDDVQIISNPYKIRKPNENIINQIQNQQIQQKYLNNLNYFPNQMVCPQPNPILSCGYNPLFGNYRDMNTIGMNRFYNYSGFKPFSSTYQEQMNQLTLNLNIYLNPYSISPILPLDLLYRQRIQTLQYYLRNKMSFANQMNNNINNVSNLGQYIVIDE